MPSIDDDLRESEGLQPPNDTTDLGLTQAGIWQLAWPMMVAMSAGTVVRFTDFAMVGDLGPSALAAVGVGGQFYWLIESIGAIAPAGLAAILARAVGAGDRDLADQVFQQAHVLGGTLVSLGCLLLFPFTYEAIAFYGVAEDVIDLGSEYLRWRLWGTIPLSIAMVFGAGLRAAGDVRTPLVAGVLTGTVNVFLNWLLIYGKWGIPALGIRGAALASNLSLLVMALFFLVLWSRGALVLKPHAQAWRLDGSLQWRLARIGIPSGIESGFFQFGLLIFQRIMAPFGTSAIAAYNVGSMLLSFSFIPGVGFAMAAATLVGQNLGANAPEAAAREARRSLYWTVGTMSLVGGLLAVLARPIAMIFSDDPSVIEETILILWILGLAHPLMAIEFALGGALRGAGDTLFPMLTVFVGLLIVRVGVAYGLVTFLNASLAVVWAVLILDYALKAVMLSLRFANGRWKTREV